MFVGMVYFIMGACEIPDPSLFQKGNGGLYEGGVSASEIDSGDIGTTMEDTSIPIEDTGTIFEDTGEGDSAVEQGSDETGQLEDTSIEDTSLDDSAIDDTSADDTAIDTGSGE